MNRYYNIFYKLFAFLIIGLALCLTIPSTSLSAKAITEDGKYEVPIIKNIKMGGKYFSDSVIVEKLDEHYYMTFSVLDLSAVREINLVLGKDKVGTMTNKKESTISYTYSLEEPMLSRTLPFEAYINAMKSWVEFSIDLKLNEAKKLSDTIDDRGERPGAYVPSIDLSGGIVEAKRGSYYQVTMPKATLADNSIPVTVSAYYLNGEEKVNVPIVENRFMLEDVGEYHVIYRAESDLYKTNLNNPTFSIVDLTIKSMVNVNNLAKVEALTEDVNLDRVIVQALKLDSESDIYQEAKELLSKKSENFEIINVELYDQSGSLITPKQNYALYLQANARYDRNNITVYHLSLDGTLTPLETKGAGRYVRVETDLTGSFIVALNGVSFVMPMWGYALITIISLMVIICIVTIIIIMVVKKRKKTRLGLVK